MTEQHGVVHAEFTIERTLAAPVATVYKAFADEKTKKQWFAGANANDGYTLDFRVGGTELNKSAAHEGVAYTFKAVYYDIVPEERIIYAYEMYRNDKRISVSIATLEFASDDKTTKVTLHEAGAFLDGLDEPEMREQGTHQLLNMLASAVE